MADQVLKDSHNRTIGKIKTRYDGKLEIYDDHNRRKGTYDPKTNTTRDDHNRSIGTANLLTTLL